MDGIEMLAVTLNYGNYRNDAAFFEGIGGTGYRTGSTVD